MTRIVIAAVLAVTLGSASVAAQAQAQDNDASEIELPIISSWEDMKCAVWASYIAGGADDPEVITGSAYALNYFIGRYEAATGYDFRSAMTEVVNEVEADPELLRAYDGPCIARWEEYLDRLNNWIGEGAEAEAEAFETLPLEGSPTA